MNHNGLDWLNLTGSNGESSGNGNLPPPPVSFGFSNGTVSSVPSSSEQHTAQVNQSLPHHHPHPHPHLHHNQVSLPNNNNANGDTSSSDVDSSRSSSTQLAQDRFNSVFNKLHISSNDQFSHSEDNLTAHTSNGSLKMEKPMSTSASSDTLLGDDNSTPLSLTSADLTQQEAKTYLRWYNDILTRKGTKTITIEDVFKFLCNFKITDKIKEAIRKIFNKYLQSLNIGQFFALLRIVAHALQGQLPSRGLIRITAGVPKPISILSRKRLQDSAESDNEVDETNQYQQNDGQSHSVSETQNIFKTLHKPDQKLDLDSFTQFILTGERPSETPKKRNKPNGKRVKFSEQLTIELESENYIPRQVEMPSQDQDNLASSNEIDYSLPMDQLLLKLKANNTGGSISVPPHGQMNGQTAPSIMISRDNPDDEEELKDMQDSINQFHNVNIDSVSIHGVPSNIPSVFFNSPGESPQLGLSPQATGQEPVVTAAPLAPNLTGSVSKSLRSTLVAPTAERPSLLDYGASTLQSQSLTQVPHSQALQIPQPPPSRFRSQSSPAPYSPKVSSPLGSALESENGNYFIQTALNEPSHTATQDQYQQMQNNPLPNTPQIQFPIPHNSTAPPPPPPSRIRSTSSPVEPTLNSTSHQLVPPPPPPPRARKNSNSPVPPPVPPLPAHHHDPITFNPPPATIYNSTAYDSPNHSGNDLLDGLRALQDEVDRLKSSTGF